MNLTASCPKMRTEPKSRILDALSKFAETSRGGTGSAIDEPKMSFPTEHPFRPAGPPELLCGRAVIITEQAAQSLTTSHLPVGTAHAFFRFEERVPESLMVALSVIMMGELDSGLWAIVWHSVALSGVVPSIYSSARTELAKLLVYGLFRKIRVLAQDGEGQFHGFGYPWRALP